MALSYLEEGAAAAELARIQGSIPDSSQTSETFALDAARLLGWLESTLDPISSVEGTSPAGHVSNPRRS
jgi:hypothetical protein